MASMIDKVARGDFDRCGYIRLVARGEVTRYTGIAPRLIEADGEFAVVQENGGTPPSPHQMCAGLYRYTGDALDVAEPRAHQNGFESATVDDLFDATICRIHRAIHKGEPKVEITPLWSDTCSTLQTIGIWKDERDKQYRYKNKRLYRLQREGDRVFLLLIKNNTVKAESAAF